ncbi:response regulator receiver protein [Actinobacteria bacterium OK074]|nr:response regulator receiver protein [Actinobacteria bacterium OK074]
MWGGHAARVTAPTHAPAARVPAARVLVVEDEAGERELLVETFRLAGYDVAAAGSGVAALNAVYARPPDVVVLDQRLPDFDGREVARILHQDGPGVPVVYLPRPLRLENVVTDVRRILGARSA